MSKRHLAAAFPLGSEMWRKELADHQKRLTSVKPTLPNPIPPSAPGSSRPSTQSARGRGAAKRLSSPPTATPSKGAPVAQNTAEGDAAASGLKISQLSVDQQQCCGRMVDVLQSLSSADSKAILEELFVSSEMKRLLAQYTGVYPADTCAADGERTLSASTGSTTRNKTQSPSKRLNRKQDQHQSRSQRSSGASDSADAHDGATATQKPPANGAPASLANSGIATEAEDSRRSASFSSHGGKDVSTPLSPGKPPRPTPPSNAASPTGTPPPKTALPPPQQKPDDSNEEEYAEEGFE